MTEEELSTYGWLLLFRFLVEFIFSCLLISPTLSRSAHSYSLLFPIGKSTFHSRFAKLFNSYWMQNSKLNSEIIKEKENRFYFIRVLFLCWWILYFKSILNFCWLCWNVVVCIKLGWFAGSSDAMATLPNETACLTQLYSGVHIENNNNALVYLRQHSEFFPGPDFGNFSGIFSTGKRSETVEGERYD